MRRIDAIEPFRVMQLLERARELEAQGRNIIHMEIGEPDLPTPSAVTEAARAWLAAHNATYTPSTGAPELQQALALWYGREYGLAIAPERFLITPGTSGAFSLIYAALLDAGESVLLPDPGYPCQRNFIRLAGGEPLSVPVGPETGYHLDRRTVEDGWQAGTRAAVVISPGNPTGGIVERELNAEVARVLADHRCWILSDEVYAGSVFDGEFVSVAALDVLPPDRVHVVWGFSKDFGMSGFRVGALIVNVAAVLYLLLSQRLFGLRGGKAAYEAQRHEASLLEVEAAGAGTRPRVAAEPVP